MSTESVVSELLDKMISEGGFISVSDSNGRTLRVIYHLKDDRFWVEIPSLDDGGSSGNYLDREALLAKLEKLSAELSQGDPTELVCHSWTKE